MEGVYLFNKDEELIGVVDSKDLTSHQQEDELNRFIKIFLSKRYDTLTESAYYIGHKDIDDDSVFHLYKSMDVSVKNGSMDIEGIHSFFDDLKSDGYIKDRRPANQSARFVLGIILEDTRWEIGRVETNKISSTTFYYQSKLSAFWDFIEKWNVEFRLRMVFQDGKIVGRYVDIYDRVSDDYGKWFERGDKLIEVVREEARSEIFTALVGRGRGEEVMDAAGNPSGGFGRRITFEDVVWKKSEGDPVDKPEGQEYVELPQATAEFGFPDGKPRIGIVEKEDIKEPELLLEATYNDLVQASMPRIEMQAKALETGITELGEWVAIVDDETELRYKTRVFKLTRNFLNQLDKTFNFGDRLTATRAEKAVQVQKTIAKNEQNTQNWLASMMDAVIGSYFNNDGYNYDLLAGNEYELPGGYYSFDRPIDQSPTKVVYMGAGKVMIANSQNPDGSWDWRTAITGDGIIADEINTGTLRADLIQSGFSNIGDGFGVIITEDGLYSVSPSGEYSLTAEGGMRFYTKNDVLNGSIESVYARDGSYTGVGVFIQPDHVFSLIRQTEGSESNKTIFQVPKDADELKMYSNLNVNNWPVTNITRLNFIDGEAESNVFIRGETVEGRRKLRLAALNDIVLSVGGYEVFVVSRSSPTGDAFASMYTHLDMHGWGIKNVGNIDASAIEAGSFKIKGTNQRIANIVGGGGAYFDTQKVSLGIGNDAGVSMKVTAFADRVEVSENLSLKQHMLTNVSNVKPYNNGFESWFFTTSDGYAALAGRNGAGIGSHNGTDVAVKLRLPPSGAMIAYADLNMNGNAVTGTSDIRLKKNFKEAGIDPLTQIDKMKIGFFEWDFGNPFNEGKPEGVQFGQVAQYAPKMMQVQNGEKDNYLSIDKFVQADLNSLGIQELHKIIQRQAEEIKETKDELADLKTMLEEKGLI